MLMSSEDENYLVIAAECGYDKTPLPLFNGCDDTCDEDFSDGSG